MSIRGRERVEAYSLPAAGTTPDLEIAGFTRPGSRRPVPGRCGRRCSDLQTRGGSRPPRGRSIRSSGRAGAPGRVPHTFPG